MHTLNCLCLLQTLILTTAKPLRQHMPSLASSNAYVTDISKCPAIKPRSAPPADIHDLRPDDLSVVMAVGDSITVGLFAAGFNRKDRLLGFGEFRGLSYAAGGDPGAITIPNFLKHYNKTLVGASRGRNLKLELCFGVICPIGPLGWHREFDQLNAAQSAAISYNLLHQVKDYLVPQVKRMRIAPNRFKYLNFQIGSVEMCSFCESADLLHGPGTQKSFEANVRRALEYVRTHVPNTLVNLIGATQVSQTYQFSNKPYCRRFLPSLPQVNILCRCTVFGGKIGALKRGQMDKLQGQYNTVLQRIVKDYKAKNYKDFAVIWQPPVIPLERYPVQALSSFDCFHPSTATHQRIAAGIWNRLTLDAAGRSRPFEWEDIPTFRCLQAEDRIQT